MQPGQHQLHVHVPYFLPSQIGPADLMVAVHPGQTLELEYRAPVWAFSPGSLGTPPQKYNGTGIMIALMVVPLVILCLCCVLNIFASSGAGTRATPPRPLQSVRPDCKGRDELERSQMCPR